MSNTIMFFIDHVVIVSIDTRPVPRVPEAERIEVNRLSYGNDGIIYVNSITSAIWKPRMSSGALGLLEPAQTEGRITIDAASYFLSKIELTKGQAPTMAAWRKGLFIAYTPIFDFRFDAAQSFGLPRDRTVVMGATNRGLGSGLRLQDHE